jgi:hypothetical protein
VACAVWLLALGQHIYRTKKRRITALRHVLCSTHLLTPPRARAHAHALRLRLGRRARAVVPRLHCAA